MFFVIDEKCSFLIHLLKCSFDGSTPENPPENLDWQDFLKFAKKHMVVATVYTAIEKIADKVPQDIFAEWKRLQFKSFVSEETFNKDRKELLDCLEENEINYLPLKGVILKYFYPNESMREMADNDILIEHKNIHKAIEVLNKIGFESTPLDEHYYDISFKKSYIANFEIHYRFVKPSDDYFYYFEKLMEKSLVVEGKKYAHYLTDEDFYITIVYHFFKHYKGTGCGVRFLSDDYLFLSKKSKTLDWKYVDEQLKILNVFDFQKEMSELARKIFNNIELSEKEIKLLSSIMDSGTFGHKKNPDATAMTFGEEKEYSAAKHFFKKLFPPFSYMKGVYPVLEKVPILLPIYYLIRAVKKQKQQQISLHDYIDTIRNKWCWGDTLSVKKENIRNFSIIAHIDHGKSTLADRILELTQSVAKREMQEQILDDMDLERERGITIKAHAVKLDYKAKNGETYEFNLIDTPGHVDFNYEVSRSLAACEGAILIIDATQGVEAQTLANTYLALDHNLDIVPVINKIDLPAAHPEEVAKEVEDVVGIPCLDAPRVSAKTGENVEDVLEKIVNEIRPPEANDDKPLKALVFDSVYDSYKGVIVYVRIVDGRIKPGDTMRMMATGAEFTVVEVGYMRATNLDPTDELSAGEVGYITASIKTVSDARVGDTVTIASNPASEALPGYRKVNPMVFCGVYPADGADYEALRDALEKLQLNDASLSYEPETSGALGFGFRCGFLGLLHLEIIQERLEREYDLDLVTTVPSVVYKIHLTDGTVLEIDNPTKYPDPAYIDFSEEPYTNANIYAPAEFVGTIMDLCQDRRGVFKGMNYITPDRVDINYELPLNEIIYDFFDVLKSRTRGYASFDYEISDYRKSDLVKIDVLLNGDTIDALSFIIHREKAYVRARRIAEKLKEHIPRQMFEIPIQIAIGGKVIARETIKAMRKDVLAKCYGGDVTRKKKLLEKQKQGKKRMRQFGTVEVPQEAFMAVLKLSSDDE